MKLYASVGVSGNYWRIYVIDNDGRYAYLYSVDFRYDNAVLETPSYMQDHTFYMNGENLDALRTTLEAR